MPETIGVDTEYHHTLTLTVQAATRLVDGSLAVQLYHSPLIPPPPPFDIKEYLPKPLQAAGQPCERVILRPARLLTDDLSPGRVLVDVLGLGRIVADVLGLVGVEVVTRASGDAVLAAEQPAGGRRGREGYRLPCVDLTLVGHFLRADITRLFGTRFWNSLRIAARMGARLSLGGHKLLGLREGRVMSPILEYLYVEGELVPLRVTMRDTILPYGPGSLDKLAQRFLGVGKCGALTKADKKDMLHTFQTRTADAYGYAAVDAVLTLLVYEEMQRHDRNIYSTFGVPSDRVPALRPTLGARVSTFLQVLTREAAAGSELLQSNAGLGDLMRRGGAQLLVEPGASHFADQAAVIHGALLFNRAPTRLAHRAPGMLADVDMSGCYPEIARHMNLYWGRPVVLEPGAKATTLRDAVAQARALAPDDGWLVYASGPISGYANALIPSLEDAVTGSNFKERRRRARRRAAWEVPTPGPADDDDDDGRTHLYTDRVDFGVVAWSTWLAVQALPPAARARYEQLRADAIVFYPRHLIAADGADYDPLVQKYPEGTPPFEGELDLENWVHVRREPIRADHVSLRFGLGAVAAHLIQLRQDARRRGGKDGAEELAWKGHGNTLLGVLGSRRKPVFNFLAANIILATARAKVWAMSQVLNGIQTITDGLTYRRDQVPACSYADCLQRKAGYPVSRAEADDGISFEDPAGIPIKGDDFTRWFVAKALSFFRVSGPEYEGLFGSHVLEHKAVGKDKCLTFDALCCDGSGNYLKARLRGKRYRALDFKARSYRDESKKILEPWMLRTYLGRRKGRKVLAPLASESGLLSLGPAVGRARAALETVEGPVYLPLGLEHGRTLAYKIVKLSAFVFCTPEQRATLKRSLERFQKETGCGLEVLALRRDYGGRQAGDVEHFLCEMERFIREGGRYLTRHLHLDKFLKSQLAVCRERRERLQALRDEADADLAGKITSATGGLLVHFTEVKCWSEDEHTIPFLPPRAVQAAQVPSRVSTSKSAQK
jgi:hypothetical protein